MQAKLIITFNPLAEADFLTLAEGIAAALTANPAFPEPWPAPLPSLAQLNADVAAYQAAYNAARSGDKQKIASREAARKTLTDELKKLASYLELIANGDTAKLLSTGYPLRRDIAKTSSANLGVLPPPDAFRLARGELSGMLIVRARKLTGAGSYEVQTTPADPTVETNWADAGTYMRCSKIELGGLPPGKLLSVRLRGIGSHSPGAWTPAASLMVV